MGGSETFGRGTLSAFPDTEVPSGMATVAGWFVRAPWGMTSVVAGPYAGSAVVLRFSGTADRGADRVSVGVTAVCASVRDKAGRWGVDGEAVTDRSEAPAAGDASRERVLDSAVRTAA